MANTDSRTLTNAVTSLASRRRGSNAIITVFLGLIGAALFIVPYNGVVSALRRENHFGSPCKLCECFVEYSDRDVAVSFTPYRMVKDPYNSTEDRCLATCIHDDRCKMVSFGYIGGRQVFTCELYEEIDVQQPIYAPFTNIYLKKRSRCAQPAHKFSPLWTIDADEAVTARKMRYVKLALEQNPFNFG